MRPPCPFVHDLPRCCSGRLTTYCTAHDKLLSGERNVPAGGGSVAGPRPAFLLGTHPYHMHPIIDLMLFTQKLSDGATAALCNLQSQRNCVPEVGFLVPKSGNKEAIPKEWLFPVSCEEFLSFIVSSAALLYSLNQGFRLRCDVKSVSSSKR